MELWVQSQVTSCEVDAGHRCTAAGFLLSLFVFPCRRNSTIRAIKSGFGSNGKIPPSSKGGPAKNMYTKSERVKLCYQQIVMLLRKMKTYATYLGLGLLSDCQSPIFLLASASSHRHCPSLLHIHLLPLPEMCVGCDCATHYHILSLK